MKLPFILKENEEIIEIFRTYGLFIVLPVTIGLILALAPWFFFVRLYDFGTAGIIVFILSQTAGWLLIIKTLYIWRRNLLVVTTLRIIDVNQKSIFNRTISEVGYDMMQNVTYEVDGVLATILNYGNLIFETIGSDTAYVFKRVKNPVRIQNVVIEAKAESMRFGNDKVAGILQSLPNLNEAEQKAVMMSLSGMLKNSETGGTKIKNSKLKPFDKSRLA